MLALLASALSTHPRTAYTQILVRGTITNADGAPIEAAKITVSTSDRATTQSTQTNRQGTFAVSMPPSTSGYRLSVLAIGYQAAVFSVRSRSRDTVVNADTRLLAINATALSPLRIRAKRPRVPRETRLADSSTSPLNPDESQLSAIAAGDLAALAGSSAGALYIPGSNGDPSGFSILGLDPSQNQTTLNGLAFGGSALPMDTPIQAAISSAPYDVASGGFSGALTAVRVRVGTDVRTRTGSVLLQDPRTQWTDDAGRALGATRRFASASGAASGPTPVRGAYYLVSGQVTTRQAVANALERSSDAALAAVGLARDSVTRLQALLTPLGLTEGTGSRLAPSVGLSASTLAVVEHRARDDADAPITSLLFSSLVDRAPLSLSPADLSTRGGARTSLQGGLQLHQSRYIAGMVLSELSIGTGIRVSMGQPVSTLPSGFLRIASQFTNGTGAVRTVAFGGNAGLQARSASTNTQLLHQLTWLSRDARHRLQVTSEARSDGGAVDATESDNGNYQYFSLADLERRTPVTFQRTIRGRPIRDRVLLGGVAVGDRWTPTERAVVQYGIRFDGNAFTTRPAFNQDLQRVLGVRNDVVPRRMHVSPRIGFAINLGGAPGDASVDRQRARPSVLRGGLGVFRAYPAATLLDGPLAEDGSPMAAVQLTCIGSEIPAPLWQAWARNGGPYPVACASPDNGGVGPPAIARSIRAIASSFQSPQSLRGNVQWSTTFLRNRLGLQLDATLSETRHQSDWRDANFVEREQFALTAEAERPVFVPARSITSAGTIDPLSARRSAEFGRVLLSESGLASRATQWQIAVRSLRTDAPMRWFASYVHQRVQEQTRGFSSASGAPSAITWNRGSLEMRHQVLYGMSLRFGDFVQLDWRGTVRSGAPYTPIVIGDINGDGFGNDRAFIGDPDRMSNAELASGLRALIERAPPGARRCLQRQLSQVAARNSCLGPWQTSAILSAHLNPARLHLPARTMLTVELSNPLHAADLLWHGSERLRGWGQPTQPDPALLFVRGFDQSTRSFRYTVNRRFGSTAPRSIAGRTVSALTVVMRIDLGPTREHERLHGDLAVGRRTTEAPYPADVLLRFLVSGADLPNPLTALLRGPSSASLSAAQRDSLAAWNTRYTQQLDSLWTALASEFATLPARYRARDVDRRYLRVRSANIDLLQAIARQVTMLLSTTQRRALPASLRALLDVGRLESIRQGTLTSLRFPPGFAGIDGGAMAGNGGVIIR